MTKTWYLSVKDETMAPARMVQFLKNHVAACEVCQTDPEIEGEIEQITELILPESKIPKAVRLQQEQDDLAAEEEAEESEESEEGEETGGDEEEDEEYMDDEEDDLDDLD